MTRFAFFWAGLFSLLCTPALGRHIVGSDLSYVYMGTSPSGQHLFKFTLTIVRDCNDNGAFFDDPLQMALYRGNWTQADLIQSFMTGSPVVTPLPTTSNCQITPPNVCFEQGAYEFVLPLAPISSGSYFIVHQRCCRQITLSNILIPDQIGTTIVAEITSEGLTYSSPVLPPPPTVLLCVHKAIAVTQTATDLEGGRLRYVFYPPLAGGGPMLSAPLVTSCEGVIPSPPCGPPFDTVPFVLPLYTFDAPMGGDPVVQLDSITGLLAGTPHTAGRFLIGLEIRKYLDNNQLVNTIRREITLLVYDETNNAAEASLSTDKFQVFPNPADEAVSLPAELEIAEVSVFNCWGRCVESCAAKPLTRLDLRGFTPGFYHILAKTATGRQIYAPLVVAR